MAARSTTQGTPVKSCSSTRAGMNESRFAVSAALHLRRRLRYRRPAPSGRLPAQQILQQNPVRNRHARNVRDALLFKRGKAKVAVFSPTHVQGGLRTKAVLAHWVTFNISWGRFSARQPADSGGYTGGVDHEETLSGTARDLAQAARVLAELRKLPVVGPDISDTDLYDEGLPR